MQYSHVDGQKVTPFPKAKGSCAVCGADTIAKCGEKIMWHWAHKSKLECDPWWEKETEWHRGWKEKFPESFREVVHQCQITGEKHRADIKADNGIILEIQNSPISLEELRSREEFYKNLVWIVNGAKFMSRFKIARDNYLPNPASKDFDDIVMSFNGGSFYRKSENPQLLTEENPMVLAHPSRRIQQLINNNYVGHHTFSWQRPHVAWLQAKCPVYMDFGSDALWRIETWKGHFRCVRVLPKILVIEDIIKQSLVQNIGSNFSIAS